MAERPKSQLKFFLRFKKIYFSTYTRAYQIWKNCKTWHSPSPRWASHNNPHPYFSKCMQNDVPAVLHSPSIFRKIPIVYYLTTIGFYLLQKQNIGSSRWNSILDLYFMGGRPTKTKYRVTLFKNIFLKMAIRNMP